MKTRRHSPRRACTAALAALLAMALPACTVLGPDFQHPAAARPTSWPAQDSAAGAVELQWWNSFNDPVLAGLIAGALDHNLDLQTAAARIEQARAQRLAIAGAQWPTLDAAAGVTRDRHSAVGLLDPSNHNGATSYTLATAGLTASWELDLWGRVHRTVEAVDAGVDAAVEQRHAVRLAVAAETAHAYIALRAAQSTAVLTQKNRAIARRSLALTTVRRDEGVATELDVARASAQVAAIEARLPALAQRTDALMSLLALLLAQPPQALSARLQAQGDVAIPAGPPLTALGIPGELAARRPDIRRASALLHAATAGIGAAQADFYPRISLGASIGSQALQLADLGSWDSRNYGIGPTISLPLFDGGRRRGMLQLSEARQREAALLYRKTVLTAWHEVEDAAHAVRAQQQRHERLAAAVLHTRSALGYAQQQYAAGSVDFLNVLAAQDALLHTEEALADSAAAASLAQVDLYKALGGGWQEPGGEEHAKLGP